MIVQIKTLGLAIVMLFLLASARGQEWKVAKGEISPEFTVTGKQDKVITTKSLRGKVVLINFFATWCPPCRAELPRLQKEIWEKWKDKGDFEVIVLAREEGWDKLDPFMSTNKYTFPVYPDLKRGVFSLFADQSIPRNVILDRNGKIIYQSIGYTEVEFSEMIKLIEGQLKK